jgi:hypothetical protein
VVGVGRGAFGPRSSNYAGSLSSPAARKTHISNGQIRKPPPFSSSLPRVYYVLRVCVYGASSTSTFWVLGADDGNTNTGTRRGGAKRKGPGRHPEAMPGEGKDPEAMRAGPPRPRPPVVQARG